MFSQFLGYRHGETAAFIKNLLSMYLGGKVGGAMIGYFGLCENLFKSKRFGVCKCVCVKTMPRKKDISNDFREAIIDAGQTGKR